MNKRQTIAKWIAITVLGATASTTRAALPGSEPSVLNAVRTAATEALRKAYLAPGSRVVANATPLDQRLHLSECPLPLRVTVPERPVPASVMTITVNCPTAGGWVVRLPVHLQVYRQVLVTTAPLRRGDGVRSTDVRSEERDITRLAYGYIDQPEQLSGRTLSRPLAANSVLAPAALGGRTMVRAGDQVQMLAQMDSIEVRASGTALGSGDNGARLKVRNDSSGRIVDAVVSAPGLVLVLP